MGRVNSYIEPFFWDIKDEVLASVDKEVFEDNISFNIDEIKDYNGVYMDEDGFAITNFGQFNIEFTELSNIIGGTCYAQYKVSNVKVSIYEEYSDEDVADLDIEQLYNENYVTEEQLNAYAGGKKRGIKAFTEADLNKIRQSWLQDKKNAQIKKDEAEIYITMVLNVQYDMDIDYISVEEIEICN